MKLDLECHVKKGKVNFDYNNVIWNVCTKNDLDQENELTNEQWLQFVEDYNQRIAETFVETAYECLSKFKDQLETDEGNQD